MGRSTRVAITLEQCWHPVPGGTASSALESIRALGQAGGFDMVGVSARHRTAPGAAWIPPIPVRSLPLPRNVLYESWHRLRFPKVQWATGPIDVIHVTGMAMPPKSAPMVVTVHDLAFLHDPTQFTTHGVRFFNRAIKLARRDADIVICPSQTTFDDCIAHGFDRARLRLVPWGVKPKMVAPGAIRSTKDRFGIGRRYVMWAGTIEPRKNLKTLLEAFSMLDTTDVDLVIAGPEGWNDELRLLKERSGERVKQVGFLNAADLTTLQAGADVFCFPSLREGFGLPVLEAMAQGTPVVTSSGTATAEIIGDDTTSDHPAGLLVDPHDVKALAAAIDRLLGDPDDAKAIGAAGLARAETFTWQRTAALLAAAFTDAMSA